VARLPKTYAGTSSTYLCIWKNSSVSRHIVNANNNTADKFWKKDRMTDAYQLFVLDNNAEFFQNVVNRLEVPEVCKRGSL